MPRTTAASSPEIVRVGLGERSYDIRIAEGLLDRLGGECGDLLRRDIPAVVLTNDALALTLGERACAALRAAGIEPFLCAVPEGEGAKTLATLSVIMDFLVERSLPRQSVLFAVGGGVIGDIGGFAAAIYLRGIACVQVPTSLLAMVDASVGGKTAVNHAKGKNLIGAFHQPSRVIVDPAVLASLPPREYRCGLAEVIKHGVIRDADFFALLERSVEPLLERDPALLVPLIRRNCEIKAAVVESDERESGLRAILNFGHTIGHAVENLAARDGMLHGEAVAIGMAGASRIAVGMGLWTAAEDARLRDLIAAVGLPLKRPPLDIDALLERMLRDKKVVGRTLRFVLPTALGNVCVRDDVPGPLLAGTLRELAG